jgi:hypothetical protein
MNSSIRDLESIDHETLSGKSELRSILESGFGVDPLLVDWILSTVAEQNRKIRVLKKTVSPLIECSCCGEDSISAGSNAAWLCEECAIKQKNWRMQ